MIETICFVVNMNNLTGPLSIIETDTRSFFLNTHREPVVFTHRQTGAIIPQNDFRMIV